MCLNNSIRGWFSDRRERKITGSSKTPILETAKMWVTSKITTEKPFLSPLLSSSHTLPETGEWTEWGFALCSSSFPHTFSKPPSSVTNRGWIQTQTYFIWLFVELQGRVQEAALSKLFSPSHQEHFTNPLQPHRTYELHRVLGSNFKIMMASLFLV